MLRSTFAIVIVSLGLTQAAAQSAVDGKTDPISPVPSPPGRYQIVMNPGAARFTFLLDTVIGRVWQLTQFTDLKNDPDAWELVPRIDSTEDFDAFVRSPRMWFRPGPIRFYPVIRVESAT